jgi:uncharacterized protein (TIGR00369 family)
MKNLTVDTPLEQINKKVEGTLVEHLGIVFTKVGKGVVEATMPVDSRTIQPVGILHGGATIALAETIAGLGSMLLVDASTYEARGIQLSTNHVSGAKGGEVLGIATIIHQGETTHIWNVDVVQGERLISTIRVTNMILRRR